MDINLADVTIHVDENLDKATLDQLQTSFRERDGVVSVHVDERRPHLFLLEYNPKLVSGQDLLSITQFQGLHAELVGL
ncbi:MAG: ATP-binding protein [gamma proteobacterium endosymbiont of Lamellibrachia anaximandri]|nr:ATP-binding protein [gamma proteobacterium endosymbiont of Lamellibrachia anaximandri]MBL3534023.1 ATP-binding protein [gamma proteobacterium endosymbiont of Lamellibrachia anaximandri]MBL3599239.1 ATP-binding protein [gamma proteobacterium endosymbiont of Lamellibrachia anaximandri]